MHLIPLDRDTCDHWLDLPSPRQEAENNGAYTVPDQVDDQLREYYMRHNASSSYFGADSINARLVTLQLRDGVIVESDTEVVPAEEDEGKVDEESNGQAPQ